MEWGSRAIAQRRFTIARVKKIHHTTILNWIKQIGELLPNSYSPEISPEVGELDELETFVGKKKHKIWIWTAVDHFKRGILEWVIGDPTPKNFVLFKISKNVEVFCPFAYSLSLLERCTNSISFIAEFTNAKNKLPKRRSSRPGKVLIVCIHGG